MHITNLRTGSEYQAAIRRIQPAKPDEIKNWAAQQDTTEYAQLRLVIGVWERISQIVLKDCTNKDVVYPCSPAGLMWDKLKPAIDVIKEVDKLPYYAFKFEEFKDAYEVWGNTEAGQKYSSIHDQAICALFG